MKEGSNPASWEAGLCFYPDIPRSSHEWRVVPRKPDWMVGIIFLPPPGIPCGLRKCIMYYLKLDEYIYQLCAIENTRCSPILNYSDTAEFYQCPQTHLPCSPSCEFHTPNSPFVPPTVIRGKYIAVMWMYIVIILILHEVIPNLLNCEMIIELLNLIF